MPDMPTIRINTYDSLARVVHIDIEPADGFARLFVEHEANETFRATRDYLGFTMSAAELDELAQAATRAAQMVRDGEF